MPDHVIHAIFPGDRYRFVAATVVNDEPFDRVESGDMTRQFGQCGGQGPCLVEARDLDDELHLEPILNGLQRICYF
ncbi:hypothetical protein D3C84_1221020 [compost metagenome]